MKLNDSFLNKNGIRVGYYIYALNLHFLSQSVLKRIQKKGIMYLLEFFKKSKPTFIFLFFFTIIVFPVIYFLSKPKTQLPVYNPVDVNPRLVDDQVRHVNNGHKVGNFNLVNQNGKMITQNDFKDKIYLADFFFYKMPDNLSNHGFEYQRFTGNI